MNQLNVASKERKKKMNLGMYMFFKVYNSHEKEWYVLTFQGYLSKNELACYDKIACFHVQSFVGVAFWCIIFISNLIKLSVKKLSDYWWKDKVDMFADAWYSGLTGMVLAKK